MLRQLITHPQEYSDDFLDLPVNMQDEIVELLDVASGEQFDLEELVPLKIERNPLLRLLSPNDNDENDKLHFETPSLRSTSSDDFISLGSSRKSSL